MAKIYHLRRKSTLALRQRKAALLRQGGLPPDLLRAVRDSRADPQVPTVAVSATLFLGALLRMPSFLQLQFKSVRLCFLAYWLSARLGGGWRGKGETEEVPRVLRHLQTIRLGMMKLGQHVHHVVMTDIPKNLNDQLVKLGLVPLFSAPPSR